MLRRKKTASRGGDAPEIPPLDFKPKAANTQEQQGLLIACRNMEQYGAAVMVLAQALNVRADQIMLDFTQQGTAVRYRVDGGWERMPPMDRPTGDGVLVIFKRLCGLNPADRRSQQKGMLPVKFAGNDWFVHLTTQGVPTGERALFRIDPKKAMLTKLADLGMRDRMREQFKQLIDSEASLFLFSGPPGHGLPTTWRVGLEAADRFVRDWHSIEDSRLEEPELINIQPHKFNGAAGETPMDVLKSLLLKQPDVLVLPELGTPEVVKLLCSEVIEEKRYLVTRLTANSAAEALLRLMATYKASATDLTKITCGVLNQRLLRRLCEKCRIPFQPQPQLLQKLGIPPGRVQKLYQPCIPPPPEQRVDANGKPIEIEICSQCGGRGYFGRAAIFELLTVNDEIRKAVLQNPKPEYVTKVAKQQGFLTLQEEGILAVATGMTSLQELQRILAGK
jgi:type II secretory ATPase GspE/PulE/Tfp pilus assembly ATPase PilB-like protein